MDNDEYKRKYPNVKIGQMINERVKMNREIEFRGLTIGRNKWVFGSLILNKDSAHIYPIATNTNYNVIPETVGEFTGLHDKYGNKIFEGDIIKNTLGLERIFYVVFNLGSFIGVYPNHKNYNYNLTCWANPNPHIEVIGNIYNNPGLISV